MILQPRTLNLTTTPSPCCAFIGPEWPRGANSRVTTFQNKHVCSDAQACERVTKIAGMVNIVGVKVGVNLIPIKLIHYNQQLEWVEWRTEEAFISCCIRQRPANTHILLVTVALGSLQEGAEWSVIWSTVCPPACATPPPRGIVYEPDPRLGFGNRQVDGCDCARG